MTMSWVIDRPRPIPSPVGLVVKNGWNGSSLMDTKWSCGDIVGLRLVHRTRGMLGLPKDRGVAPTRAACLKGTIMRCDAGARENREGQNI